MALANLRGCSGPGVMIWLSPILDYGSFLQVVTVRRMGSPSPSPTHLHREKRRVSLLLRSQRLFVTSLLRP